MTTDATLTPLCSIEPAPVRWLFAGVVPYGRAAVIHGMKGTGKTAVCMALARIATTQGTQPEPAVPMPGRVIILQTPDHPPPELRARLSAAGADLTRITLMRPATPTDIGAAINAQGSGPVLVIADPVTSVRTLRQLDDIAQATGAAVIATTRTAKPHGNRLTRAAAVVLLTHPGHAAEQLHRQRVYDPPHANLHLQHSTLSAGYPATGFRVSGGAAIL